MACGCLQLGPPEVGDREMNGATDGFEVEGIKANQVSVKERQGGPSLDPSHPVSVALSGGGHRATVFSLDALMALRDARTAKPVEGRSPLDFILEANCRRLVAASSENSLGHSPCMTAYSVDLRRLLQRLSTEKIGGLDTSAL